MDKLRHTDWWDLFQRDANRATPGATEIHDYVPGQELRVQRIHRMDRTRMQEIVSEILLTRNTAREPAPEPEAAPVPALALEPEPTPVYSDPAACPLCAAVPEVVGVTPSLCVRCGAPLYLDAEERVRALTPDEVLELPVETREALMRQMYDIWQANRMR